MKQCKSLGYLFMISIPNQNCEKLMCLHQNTIIRFMISIHGGITMQYKSLIELAIKSHYRYKLFI